MSTARLTPVQQHLSDIIGKTARRSTSTIARGPMEHDIFGRRLNLQGQFVETSDSSARLNTAALDLSAALKSNTGGIETALKGEVMYYDVRSKTLRQQPALAALMALAYAKELQVRSGKPDGHVINVAVDCYAKHYDMMSVFADTIARSEAVQNGGGVIFWGVQNGGSIRNVAEFQSAANLAGGNWIYGTVSHLAKPEIAGTKLGMLGKVFCGTDLMKDLYARLTTGDFAALRAVENAADNFITVGDMTAHNLAVAEDMIRARTGATCPTDELLAGLRIGTDICHSPLGLNFYLMASHFGADVRTLNENLSPDFSVADITDPNEHETPKMAEFRTRTYDRRTWGILDPDADRGTFIALNANGVPVSLTGTHLLMLTAYNLATHNPQGLDNSIIYDKRTGLAIQLLVEALNAKGHKIGLIDAEPGYPFFMRAMGETTAAAAVENTCHFFLAPNTNPLFGAPISYPGVQGGDDAALALIYLLAAAKHQWQGRNPVQQLDWMRQEFGIPPTIIREFKPGLPQEYALKKYDVAEAMKTYVKKELEPTRNYKVDYMVSGVGVQSLKTKATVLVRFSNTGPTFTTSGEALSREDSDQAFKLGASIMEKGVKAAGVENVFLWKDLAPFKP